MKTALRFVIAAAVPLALAACNQTSNNSSGGLFGGSGGGLFGSGGSDSYARNGRCDDPRYNTSNGGHAEAGTDDYDCSRYGNGLKR